MTLKNSIVTTGVGAAIFLAALSSRAQVTLSIINPNSGSPGNSFCEYAGISATLGGNPLITAGADWIGIYSFNVAPGSSPAIPNTFYSVCLSPSGVLNPGSFSYNVLTFAQANPGINPSSWATQPGPGGALWGIQNANYLFSTFSAAIIQGNGAEDHLIGSTADQGAALALAMYSSLYNSTAYGVLGASAFHNTSTDANVDTDYNSILSALGAYTGATLATGYVLEPTVTSSQDLILLGTDLPQSLGVVPEPSTVIAGALLILPFGASTLRILHRKRAVAQV